MQANVDLNLLIYLTYTTYNKPVFDFSACTKLLLYKS